MSRDVSQLTSASAPDLIAIRELLEGSGLPTSDLESARPEFVVVRERGEVVAAGALERFGSSALVRSVVVSRERRGAGLGREILDELERRARASQIERLILLTQTAGQFFVRRGYRVIERGSAPQEVQQSEEFRTLCPGSATCMAKNLT
jgi:amino-acid N-acetyltransferase